MSPQDEKTKNADTPTGQPGQPTGSDRDGDSGTRYFNVTTSPVTYDDEGHTVGAGEWTPPVNLDAIGRAARRNGHLQPTSALPS